MDRPSSFRAGLERRASRRIATAKRHSPSSVQTLRNPYLDIARPQLPASKSKPLRMPVPVITKTLLPSVTGEGDDMFCFRIFTLPLPSGSLPDEVAFVSVDTPKVKVVAIGDIQKDALVPDDRGGAAPTGHRQLPANVFVGGPAQRQIFLTANSIQRGTAPLRPVLGANN